MTYILVNCPKSFVIIKNKDVSLFYPGKDKCSCHDSGVCLDSRHASWVIAALLLTSFGFFVVGYFMGKRSVIQDLHVTADQDSLADKIYTSLYTLQENKAVVAQQQDDEIFGEETIDGSCGQDARASLDVEEAAVKETTVQQDVGQGESSIQDTTHGQTYYAQLVGFGTAQAAEKFAQKLQKNKIPVVVKHRHSKTAKGKKITWYQVVTQAMSDKTDLEKMVDAIKTKERLKDVRIVTC